MLAPLQRLLLTAKTQRNTVAVGMFLQHAQVELHHVPADDDIGIVTGEPGVKLLQQLWPAVEVDQLKIQLAGITVRRAEHIHLALAAALQPDAVQLAVLGGFDVERHPFQLRTVIGMRLEARVDEAVAARLAAEPHRCRDKALHQVAFRRADICFIHRNAVFTQAFFDALQLSVAAAIESQHRSATKIFQIQRLQARMALVANQRLGLRLELPGNKRH